MIHPERRRENLKKIAEMEMSDEELKPCPFCGGEAKLENMGFPHHVYCTNCGARVTGRGFGEDGEADAIRKWNQRSEVSKE